MDWRKLRLQVRSLMAVAVALATWTGCDGAPEPKRTKSTRDAGPVDTDAMSVGIDANQPSFDMLDETLDEEPDAGNGTD